MGPPDQDAILEMMLAKQSVYDRGVAYNVEREYKRRLFRSACIVCIA